MAFHKALFWTISLFLYMIDFKNQINWNMKLVQFADDTSILSTGNSSKDIRTSLLETLEKVHEYLNENKMVVNVVKTELDVFGEENNLENMIY